MADRDLTPVTPEPGTVDLWDRADSRSLLNLLPLQVQSAMLEAGKSKPQWFGLDERTLFKTLKTEGFMPTQTDNFLRTKFWLEYELAQEERRKMNISQVYAGVCVRQYFYGVFLERPDKMAWLCTPPMNYETKLEEALAFGMDRMRDFLEMDPMVGGKPNIKLMELQAKITAMLDMRKKGAYTQKIEQKNMNLNVSTSDKAVAAALTGANMDQLNARIKVLEQRERQALNLSTPEPKVEVLPPENSGE